MTDIGLSPPPFELEEDLADLVELIRVDTAGGPITLARRGVEAVLCLTDKAHYERPLHIWMEVHGLARALLEARPECMPLVNLASATVEPLPELYGRGKDEGARMRADLRTRAEAWLMLLESRAIQIEALRASCVGRVVSARAVTGDYAYLSGPPMGDLAYVIAGPEKFVPPNYALPSTGLEHIPLASVDGILTGDGDQPASVESVRQTIASLRFATTLL